MSPDSPPSQPLGSNAERRRHDRRNTLTALRLQTQLLLRLARRQEDPAWQRMVAGLTAIDADITRLVEQLDHDDDR